MSSNKPGRSNTPQWEAPTFSYGSQYHAEESKSFYTIAVDLPKAMDIGIDSEEDIKKRARNM